MINSRLEKSKKFVLFLNTLDFIIGIFCLIVGNLIAVACCLFLLSLNFLWIYPWNNRASRDTNHDDDMIDLDLELMVTPINYADSGDVPYCDSYALLPNHTAETWHPIELLSFLNDFLKEYDSALSRLAVHTIIHTSADNIIVQIPHCLLRIALLNIMDNTLKYLPQSGTITITLSILDTQALLIWKDNGHGISQDEVPDLLDLNVQGSNRLSGNGLGLTQTQAAIIAGKGTISIKSSLGKGFAIYLQLPLVPPDRNLHNAALIERRTI